MRNKTQKVMTVKIAFNLRHYIVFYTFHVCNIGLFVWVAVFHKCVFVIRFLFTGYFHL